MMRKTITRTLTRCTIGAYRMTKIDGKPSVEELEPITAWGKVSEKEAEKIVAEKYGKACMIDFIEHDEETYQIDVEKFVENAVKIEQVAMDIPNSDEPEQIEA